jgi:hypothetical protein
MRIRLVVRCSETPLRYAASNGNVVVAKLLLSHGAYVHSRSWCGLGMILFGYAWSRSLADACRQMRIGMCDSCGEIGVGAHILD